MAPRLPDKFTLCVFVCVCVYAQPQDHPQTVSDLLGSVLSSQERIPSNSLPTIPIWALGLFTRIQQRRRQGRAELLQVSRGVTSWPSGPKARPRLAGCWADWNRHMCGKRPCGLGVLLTGLDDPWASSSLAPQVKVKADPA